MYMYSIICYVFNYMLRNAEMAIIRNAIINVNVFNYMLRNAGMAIIRTAIINLFNYM